VVAGLDRSGSTDRSLLDHHGHVTSDQARIARAAYRDYGRGSGHPAGLNFGDCFAYALANATGEPLLFNGDDFARTDVQAAVGDGARPMAVLLLP
jgi:uncharacterized protein with PIN domain